MTPIDYGLLVCASFIIGAFLRLAYLTSIETDDGSVPCYRTKDMERKMASAWEWAIAGAILFLMCAVFKAIAEIFA
jgi:hypothetical protein